MALKLIPAFDTFCDAFGGKIDNSRTFKTTKFEPTLAIPSCRNALAAMSAGEAVSGNPTGPQGPFGNPQKFVVLWDNWVSRRSIGSVGGGEMDCEQPVIKLATS